MVCQSRDSRSYSISSPLYRWDGAELGFQLHQNILTKNCRYVDMTSALEEHMMVVVNGRVSRHRNPGNVEIFRYGYRNLTLIAEKWVFWLYQSYWIMIFKLKCAMFKRIVLNPVSIFLNLNFDSNCTEVQKNTKKFIIFCEFWKC